MIIAAVRSLRSVAKSDLKEVQGLLKTCGEYFFSTGLDQQEHESVRPEIDLKALQEQVMKLEEASFILLESLELPELLAHGEEASMFARQIIESYRDNKEQINEELSLVLESVQRRDRKHWSSERLLTLEKNILRLATAELLGFPGTHGKIIIDEAVNAAEKYSGDEGAKFVNGVLADLVERLRPGHLQPPQLSPEIR